MLCDQNLWFHQKCLVIRNTHVKYDSPMSNGKKVMCKVEVFQMYVKGHGQGHVIKITNRKGLFIRNTLAKYESPIS